MLQFQGAVMSNHADVAVQKHIEGYNCAQSVLFAYCQELDLDPDTALKLSCGFGAGMGRKGEVCGALTGGILVLGAKYGRGTNEDRPVTIAAYAKVRDLMDNFRALYGVVRCRELLNGCDMTTDEGQKYYKDNDLTNKVCNRCIASVAQLVENMLDSANR
jgi:C_GCAxxG_C_C family probable redox protein